MPEAIRGSVAQRSPAEYVRRSSPRPASQAMLDRARHPHAPRRHWPQVWPGAEGLGQGQDAPQSRRARHGRLKPGRTSRKTAPWRACPGNQPFIMLLRPGSLDRMGKDCGSVLYGSGLCRASSGPGRSAEPAITCALPKWGRARAGSSDRRTGRRVRSRWQSRRFRRSRLPDRQSRERRGTPTP